MISGAELPGLILAVPQTVEYVVKIIRMARQWEGIDGNVTDDLLRAERAGEMLNLVASLISRVAYPEELQTQLQARLSTAVNHCQKTTQLLRSWDSCLGSSIKSRSSSGPDERVSISTSVQTRSDESTLAFAVTKVNLSGRKGMIGVRYRQMVSSLRRRASRTARCALSKIVCRAYVDFDDVLDKWSEKGLTAEAVSGVMKIGRKESDGDGTVMEDTNDQVDSVTMKCRAFHKVRFLATGVVELKESIAKMQASISSLNDFIHLVAILPSTLSCDDDIASFIADAKCRAFQNVTVEVLEEPPSMVSLDDADTTMLSVITSGPHEGCIVDRRPVRHLWAAGRGEQAIADTHLIAKLLANDPQKRKLEVPVLRCCAFMQIDPLDDYHELIFRPIPETTPLTLRKIFSQQKAIRHSLNDRYSFALSLATAIHVFHAMGLVHGGVRPESILVMEPPQKENGLYILGKPYLAGFNYSRSDASFSGLRTLNDVAMAEHLYHHPRHLTGQTRHHAYQMSDDAYGLGVCLLEIGLWRSFFMWSEEEKTYLMDKQKWDSVHLVSSYVVDKNGEYKPNKRVWFDRRDALIRAAENELPLVMGYQYSDIVTYCLRFEENVPAGGEGGGGDYSGSLRFLDHVLSELRRLVIPRKSRS